MPRISVIMPMYNGLPYVEEAIESIMNQTFQDWELLVVDDASTDGSPEVVRGFARKDNRIKLLANNTGIRGAGPSRNIGIDSAAGEYVAMMDADDISLPARLETQVAFMDAHPEIIMSGCYSKAFDKRHYVHRTFTSDFMIKALILFYPVFGTATIIFRRNVVTERYPSLRRGQDLVFCLQVTQKYPVANLPRILYRYRVTGNSFVNKPEWMEWERKKLEVLLPMRLGFTPTSEQLETHMGWEKLNTDISPKRKLGWIWYVITHGTMKWYERPIVLGWYISYGVLKRIFLMWFGR